MYDHPRDASTSQAPKVSQVPQSVRELIEDAKASGDWNAVADWFEDFDWSQAKEIPISEFVLWRDLRMGGQVGEAVAAASAGGTTWDRIGEILGISGPEARQRYGTAIDETEAVSR